MFSALAVVADHFTMLTRLIYAVGGYKQKKEWGFGGVSISCIGPFRVAF